MPAQKPPPFTAPELIGAAVLIVAVAIAFESRIVSPDEPYLGLARVVVAILVATSLVLPILSA